jgi:hypothetical protein
LIFIPSGKFWNATVFIEISSFLYPTLRDLGECSYCCPVRKLKHTVNKVSSLRDLSTNEHKNIKKRYLCSIKCEQTC